MPINPTGQSTASIEKNVSFFRDRRQAYTSKVETLDTYCNIRGAISKELHGIRRLLDVGNGSTFDYDSSAVPEVMAIDLFLEDLATTTFPPNVRVKNGSALDLPEPDASFDGILMSMLIHHLVGTSVKESLANAARAFGEAWRVLKPGGKFILMESCVPAWFYAFERVVFPLVPRMISVATGHPVTIQFTPELISELAAKNNGAKFSITQIPKGRWVLQYGLKFPSALTPIWPYLFIARKEAHGRCE
jgi:SAM-dependent methyltransferase